MSNFSLNPAMVRGDLFQDSGKWKYTVQINMAEHWGDSNIYDAVLASYMETPPEVRGVIDGATDYWLVVTEPYHRNSYPVMVKI